MTFTFHTACQITNPDLGFEAEIHRIGSQFTSVMRAAEAIREHVRQREEEPDWSVVIPRAEPFEKEDV